MTPLEANGTASVAVVDEHDAIHAAVELWCSQAQPPIGFAGNYFSAEQFLSEHPSPSESGVGLIVLELQCSATAWTSPRLTASFHGGIG